MQPTTTTPTPTPTGTIDQLVIGLDVGSTTVKATAVDPTTKAILWSDYRRHNTRQPETALDILDRIQAAFPSVPPTSMRLFVTGSGAGPLVEPLGAKFVQEVNAVAMAVEALHPDVRSVVELGGQDAKIIMFRVNEETGDKQVVTSMNDKCASGTGATIDKCMIKVGMPEAEVRALRFDPTRLHHVAAKCGVFAETDIVNLVKSGIPAAEILNSLADAIVMQNLSVLTRGNTLKDKVLLLGGPNTFLPFLQDCWRLRIPETWASRGHAWDASTPVEDLVFVPENSQYYAAYGAVLHGLHEPAHVGRYEGPTGLARFIEHGRKAHLAATAGPGLVASKDELEDFREQYRIPRFVEATFAPGEVVRAVIGLDGGSTSSKAVLVDESGRILLKEYVLSKGNPIQDTKEMLAALRGRVEAQGARLDVLGFGATGYAADVLQESLRADVNIVETVAHMMSAVHFFGTDIDIICDIGGQDIKVLFMQHGDVRNFRLSNQCSAGNGMLLQAMADQFGVPVVEYAEHAFQASLSPKFSYGCAVFLDSDRVNFQKEGYAKEELLAGLAMVLPKNVWQYVVQIPRMAALGKRYVLQGGTQKNLAALKAQVDYIKQRVPDAEVLLHPHTGEAGAIGAAMETLRVVQRKGRSTFIGLDAAIALEFTAKNDEETRCTFCPNNCSRTFIDTKTPDGSTSRYISGFSCEKGTVESLDALKRLQKERNKLKKAYPNLVDYEAKLLFRDFFEAEPMPAAGTPIDAVEVKVDQGGLLGKLFGPRVTRTPVRRGFQRSTEAAAARRRQIRIGIPRALNIWSTAPFWRTYLQTLGIPREHVVFSDETTEEMWLEGGKYGSVDPCFPAKVTQAHFHQLLFHGREAHDHSPVSDGLAPGPLSGPALPSGSPSGRLGPERDSGPFARKLDYIFFPCITHLTSPLRGSMDTAACPIVAGTPNVMKAAFTKEIDFFAKHGVELLDPSVTFHERHLLERQLFECFGSRLDVTKDESDFAVAQAFAALAECDRIMEEKGKEILEQVEADDAIALLMIGRPYHLDPGLNHGVMDEFQVLGYPILSIRSIPKDPLWLARFFADDLASGRIEDVLAIGDVWPENYSANSAMKVWAARFAARHPNVALLDLSSFKCGHDAPTYGIIDNIVGSSGVPYSALHDIDANKPSGSIKIRVKTYAYTLQRHAERLADLAHKKAELAYRVDQKRVELLELKRSQAGPRLDPALASELAAARERMRAYESRAAERAQRAAPSNVVQLGALKLGQRAAASHFHNASHPAHPAHSSHPAHASHASHPAAPMTAALAPQEETP
ncbi:MAG: CoA activase [Deltaproteobacteria bacterium]|nr:CoA activase [Deltaproteobacteria bacterium]